MAFAGRARSIAGAALSVVMLAGSAALPAAAGTRDRLERIEQRRGRIAGELTKLGARSAGLSAAISGLDQQITAEEHSIAGLDAELAALGARIDEVDSRLDKAEDRVVVLADDLDRLREALVVRTDAFTERAVAAYKAGPVAYAESFFSSEDLGDLADDYAYYESALGVDAGELAEIDRLEQVAEARAELVADERAGIARDKATLEADRAAVEQVRSQRSEALRRLRALTQQKQQLLSDTDAEQDRLGLVDAQLARDSRRIEALLEARTALREARAEAASETRARAAADAQARAALEAAARAEAALEVALQRLEAAKARVAALERALAGAKARLAAALQAVDAAHRARDEALAEAARAEVVAARVSLRRLEAEAEAAARELRSARREVARARRAAASARREAVAPGAAAGGGRFLWPTQGGVSSPYGYRIHPIFGTRRLHTGVDIGGAYGAPVRSGDDGIVVFAGVMSGYGNAVVVDHGGGLATTYNHLSAISVSSGWEVSRGERLGSVGCTGYCTGPHLHFEVRVHGTPVNPMPYL